MENIYKNASGQYLLKQLFYETASTGESLRAADTERSRVLYTLKDQDYMGYPSLRRLYLQEADESEFLVASKYFGGWPHWKRLLQCSWFLDYLSDIREELSVKQAAQNLQRIREKATGGDFQSNRYLLEGSWRPKDSVGRPSKKKIKEEADRLFKSSEEISDDLDRISRELNMVSYS